MKFKFKIQKCQTDAVEATADVFAGRPNRTASYTRDLGMRRDRQKTFDDMDLGDRECDPCAIPPGFIATTIAIHLGERMG